jgi:anthranilate/para-aminobenzoate synthase component I
VACELRPGWTLRGLFEAMFPGGSITGAPKRRTVEIIDELEGEARGIYCGAIVLLEAEGLRVSIPIRTGVLDEQGLELRSGGGIVLDSEAEAERLETLAKARAFDSREWS